MTIADQARQMVAAAKRVTTTYDEALKVLGSQFAQTTFTEDGVDAYTAAVNSLYKEMRLQPHGANKKTAAVGATDKQSTKIDEHFNAWAEGFCRKATKEACTRDQFDRGEHLID